MTERDLDRALRSLPRTRARPGFTGEVLDRLEGPARFRARSIPWTRLALAAGAAAIAVFAVVLSTRDGDRTSPERRMLDELRAEHASIAREIDLLRAGPSFDPVLYLGGDDSVAYVVELDSLARLAARPASVPASEDDHALDR